MSAPMNCRNCDGVLGARNRSGYCRTCAPRFARPGHGERVRQGVLRRFAIDPAYRDELRRRRAEMNRDPVEIAKRTRHFIANRVWEAGKGHASTPEARAKAGRTISNQRLAHIPPHLRDEYRRLCRSKRMKAAEATAIILEQEEREVARARRLALAAW